MSTYRLTINHKPYSSSQPVLANTHLHTYATLAEATAALQALAAWKQLEEPNLNVVWEDNRRRVSCYGALGVWKHVFRIEERKAEKQPLVDSNTEGGAEEAVGGGEVEGMTKTGS